MSGLLKILASVRKYGMFNWLHYGNDTSQRLLYTRELHVEGTEWRISFTSHVAVISINSRWAGLADQQIVNRHQH